MKRTLQLTLAMLLVLAVGLTGCGDSDESDNNGSNGENNTNNPTECVKQPPTMPNAHACWHACKDLPVDTVEAVADPDASSPPTVVRGSVTPIELQENGDGQYEGWVLYDAPVEPGSTKNIFVHTVNEVSVSARLAESGSDMISADQTEFDCEYGLAWSNSMPMEDAEHYIKFGPTDQSSVTMVLVPENGPYMPEDG